VPPAARQRGRIRADSCGFVAAGAVHESNNDVETRNGVAKRGTPAPTPCATIAPRERATTTPMLPEPDDTLDTFGRLCPVPIIMTAKRVRTLAAGAVLAVLSDDRGILEDMPLWCRASRNELLAIEEVSAGEWRALVRKGADAR